MIGLEWFVLMFIAFEFRLWIQIGRVSIHVDIEYESRDTPITQSTPQREKVSDEQQIYYIVSIMACPENYRPSKTLLKSSLRNQVKEYPRVAALHGIAYVADPTRPKLERLGWFVCVVASTIAALSIIFTLMDRFHTDPMMNSLELRFSKDAPLDLPQFYICPPWESFNHIPVSKKHGHTFYKRLYEWDFGLSTTNITYPDSLDNSINLKELFLHNAPSCDQFIRHTTLRLKNTKQFNCSASKATVTSAGICFIFQPRGHVKDVTEVSVPFNITMFPTKVYATLGKDTKLLRHLASYVFRFPASATIEVQETYTSPDAEVLMRSQRKCFFPGEQSPYVECVLDCRIANALKFCGCVPWYLAKDGIKECQINRYECLDNNSDNIVDVGKCNCQLPCDNIILKNNELEVLPSYESCRIKIRERSLLTYKRTVRYGWSDLFVSFGGIAGLFLGCSLLSIIEFGYYFTLRTYCGAVLSSPKNKHNVIKINVLDVAHPVDLTRSQKCFTLPKKSVTFYDYVN